MSKELLEYVNKLDVRVFTTISGRQLIGEVEFDENQMIMLHSPLQFIKSYDQESKKNIITLVSPVIENTSCIKLNPSAIESETIADMRLKKVYCDQLIYNQLELMVEGLDLVKEPSNDSLEEPRDYFKSVIDNWKK